MCQITMPGCIHSYLKQIKNVESIKMCLHVIYQKVLDEAGNVYKGKESSAIEKVKMIYNVCLNTTATEALGSKALLEVKCKRC